jgi:hypothetical protein
MKHPLFASVVGLALAIIVTSSSAETANAPIHAIGNLSCGRWVADHQDPRSVQVVIDNQWLAGFLTGESVSLDMDLLKGTELSSLALAVTKYCEANPLEESMAGALDVAVQIAQRRGLCARGYKCATRQ